MANEAASGAGAPAGGDAGQGTGGGQGTGQQNATGGGQQPVAGQGTGGQAQGQQGGQGGQRQYVYNEDRSDYVPRHRLNEATGKLKQEIDALRQQLQEHGGITTRLKQALSGEPSDADKQTGEIKEALLQLFPGLKAIEKLTEEQLQEIMEASQNAQQSAHNHWTQHATRMFDTLQGEVTKALGTEKLTDSQIRRLRGAYRDELASAYAARQRAQETGEQYDASNDALSRHERGDVNFVKEFAKAYLDDWFEPARRTATQQALRRQQRPVPSGGRQVSNVTTKLPEIDYNNEDAFRKALAEARGQG